MAKTITLTDVDFSKNEATVSIGGAAYTDVTVDGTGKKVIVGGYGAFYAPKSDAVVFTADASLNGEVELVATSVSGAAATLAGANFSAATAGVNYKGTANMTNITGGAGNDTIDSTPVTVEASVNAGAGNDSLKVGGSDTNATHVTLGAGADTIDIASGKAVKIADYNYYEGDVIKSADTVKVGADGTLALGNSTNSVVSGANGVAVQDNWYAAKVDNASAITDYFTAVGGNNVNVTKDLSKSVIANFVDASGAKSANITLGHGSDTVSLSSGVDTVAVGKSAGNNVTDISSDDVIAIDGANLSNISLAAGTTNVDKVAVKYAASTVETGVATTGGSLNFNDGSKTHKLAFDNITTAGTIKYATASDADWFVGTSGGGTTLEVGATTHLHDASKYQNITNISVSTDAKLDAPISLTGATGKDNKIDAANAKVGVAAWGFSSGSDTIALSATNKAQDTVWFGAGDGNDTISGFAYGTASDSDVLYLKDTKTLKDIDVAFDSTGGDKAKFTVGKAVADVNKNGVASSSDVAQIKLADEKTYKVAGEYTAANGVTINTDDIDGLDYYAFAGDGNAKAVSITGSKDWIFHSLYTDFYTTGANVATVDASKATGNVTLAAAASIQGGAGTNNIWTYQANNAATVTAGTGTDIIWFAENADQAVSVSSFAAGTDVVKFATAQSLKEIAEGYTFEGGTDTAIKGVNNTDSVLTLYSVSDTTIDLVDANDKAYKALVNKSATKNGTFTTDVNIYAGMETLTAGGSVEGTVSVRVGKESRGLSSDTYFIDDSVKTFDASTSTATFWIAGNANIGTTIKGGLTENYLYGGGAASDDLAGSVAAKDTFYFGTGDGTDIISGGVDKEDTIALWNVADADIANVSVSINKSNQVEISLSDSSKLTITDANGATALTDGLTFTSASQTAYTYDSKSKTLVKKA